MTSLSRSATAEDYARVFAEERARTYPAVDAFEARTGYALERPRMEDAARVLACPVKINPPSWQHGRVLYAVAREYLKTHVEPFTILDIGSAKGFSALCLQWALNDSGKAGAVISVDVIDPASREPRNSVADIDGGKTLAELLAPWPEAGAISFRRSTGVTWLDRHPVRVHLAFVDGKHSSVEVSREGQLLSRGQAAGDVVVFDDVQIPGVAAAVESMSPWYALEYVAPKPERIYAIGVRR